MYSQEIEVRGHLIDSMILSKIFDRIMDMGGEFEVVEFSIGRRKHEHSHIRLLVRADGKERLDSILKELYRIGAVPAGVEEAVLQIAPADGVPPDGFYVTTNHPTQIYLGGRWIDVRDISAYGVIVYGSELGEVRCKPTWSVKKGELVVIGDRGIKVNPPERPREGIGIFEFMSTPTPKMATPSLISSLAEEMMEVEGKGGRIMVAAGSAVVHTGAADNLASIIHKGFVDVLVSGNGLMLHDIEYRLYGTSMGISVRSGAERGYGNHVRAAVRAWKEGGLRDLVENGVVREGIVYESVTSGIDTVIVAGAEDEALLPDAITDVKEAQRRIAKLIGGVELVLILAGSVAAPLVLGSLPSTVKLVLVDINPAVAIRMLGKEIAQSVGVISDVASFLPLLDDGLPKLPVDALPT